MYVIIMVMYNLHVCIQVIRYVCMHVCMTLYGAKWPMEFWHVTGTQSSLIYSRTMHMTEACPKYDLDVN